MTLVANVNDVPVYQLLDVSVCVLKGHYYILRSTETAYVLSFIDILSDKFTKMAKCKTICWFSQTFISFFSVLKCAMLLFCVIVLDFIGLKIFRV